MQQKAICNNWLNRYSRFFLQAYFFLLFIFTFHSATYSQSCPPNIDFENGNFDGWTCYSGYTAAVGNENVITLTSTGGASFNRQTMYSANTGETDPFGGFPVICPNGSGHSIRLGNNQGGGQADGISYEFTIPANENSYSLIYHYAVVFQAPNHRPNEQPRMEIEVTNVSDNKIIECASFTFIAMGSSLPGFQVSTITDSATVLYKDWAAVTVDLSGNAGKTIRMFFKTADCTFRRHFGYAYIDVDSECSGSFVGASYCPDDTAINITAPYGYSGYTWYDSSLSNVIGSGQVLSLSPAPASGTSIAVKLDPFDGFGCPNTLFARLVDTLTVTAKAGNDGLSCNQHQVEIGGPPKNGWRYRWTPETGLNNPTIANPLAAPATTTAYIVQTNNAGGGCKTFDTVIIRASYLDTSMQLIGKAKFCIDNGDSALLKVQPATTIQWYKNGLVINGARQPTLRVSTSGLYSAQLTNLAGCDLSSIKQPILIGKAQAGITYPAAYALINTPLVLNARPIGETALWKPGTSLNPNSSFTPSFTGSVERIYTVNITTEANCLTVDTQVVKIVKGIEIYVPTGFTPNNDGKNDFLRPILRGIKELRYFRIFNRWGNLLYEIEKEGTGWNGIFKGTLQPTQTVVWALECVGLDNKTYVQRGTSVLLR